MGTAVTEFVLHRYEDVSGVSGEGDVAWGCEFPDGAVALRWPGEHPSTATWGDIRDAEAIHGHGGKTVVMYKDSDRLLVSYQHVMPFLLNEQMRPITCGPHPDHVDRLRLTFKNEAHWAFWIALFDGSTFAATHVEVAGELRHRWISPEGDLFLEWWERPESTNSPAWGYDDDPLEQFHREDR